MELKTKEDLLNLLKEYDTRLTTLQEVIDNQIKDDPDPEPEPESEEEPEEEEIELDELDKLLNED